MAMLNGELRLNKKAIFTFEDIQKNYSYLEILRYFKNRRLFTVCNRNREIYENLQKINTNLSDLELSRQIANALKIDFNEDLCKKELSIEEEKNNYKTEIKQSSIFFVKNENKEKKFLETMAEDIQSLELPEIEKNRLMKNLLKVKEQKVNILITGSTGCGKSSTINALFDTEVAKVGVGVDPETMEIKKYELDGLILWDSPGLGDGKEADKRHSKNIINKLKEVDATGKRLIDLVLVILDGSTRDLGTSYDLINTVIIPNLGNNKENRILVAINQADVAMKGRYWDEENNCPEPELTEFLENKVISVKNRIKDATGVEVTPIYYTAGYKEKGKTQCKPYNLTKLLYYIINYIPENKMLNLVQNINVKRENWKHDDSGKNNTYVKTIAKKTEETVKKTIWKKIGEKAKTLVKNVRDFFKKIIIIRN